MSSTSSPDIPDFPPPLMSLPNKIQVIDEFCQYIARSNVEESPCHCCGRLHPIIQLTSFSRRSEMFEVLYRPGVGVTRQERKNNNDPIEELDGPILMPNITDPSRVDCCRHCTTALTKGRLPKYSLANGNWVGDVPACLASLNFAEKMLVACNRHNACIINITEGRHKLRCNAVVWSQPTQAVTRFLPPTPQEISEVLAIYFTGSEPPTHDVLKRTPLLVRRSKVQAALLWLIKNHQDYYDISYSDHNLSLYSEDSAPVSIIHTRTSHTGDEILENSATHSDPMTHEDGWNGSEPCVFAVSGLSEVEY
ncbi:hypothetical protein CPB86DRAFT_718490, partial [Serendipita vermifera]